MTKIVFCGGGTAGHVTPNLALIDAIKNTQNYYVGTNGIEKQLTLPYLQSRKLQEYYVFDAYKLRRKICFSNLLLPFKLAKSVRQAKSILKKIKPNVVFSKGGYASLPVIIASKKLGVNCIIHESDLSMGLANKISCAYATKVLTAFDVSPKYQRVGMIVRKDVLQGDRQKGLQLMGFDGKKPILLVLGGSLGAKALNDAVARLPQLANKYDIYVVTGKGKKLQVDFVKQCAYTDNIADIFACSTLCLTRAGSTTLSELALANLPFVSVPLTKQSRGEQSLNANYFAKMGCGLTLQQERLEQRLEQTLDALLANANAIIANQKKLSALLYGTDKVATIIADCCKQG